MRLTKYHGLGNDFLVLLDVEGSQPIDADVARAVCDRHRGVGADGLVRVTRPAAGVEADVAMELRNADGTRAETSGNGLRCVARAVVDAGIVPGPAGPGAGAGPGAPTGPVVVVATDAGLRRAVLGQGDMVAVEMGVAKVEPLPAVEGAPPAVAVDMGNPHLVVLDDGAVDLETVGRSRPTANVEVIRPGPEPGQLTMRVWERGVGETMACGSGACAAAAAAAGWGLASEQVIVHQPGGAVVVDLSGETIVLTGPAVRVCAVELP